MIRRLALAPIVAALLLWLAPCGHAATYDDWVAGQFSTTNHVVIDPTSKPTLPQADDINTLIQNQGVPMWVANVDPDETGAVTPDTIKDALYASHNPITNPIKVDGKDHRPPLIILVIDAKGYHARSFDVSRAVADQTGPAITDAARAHHGDLYGAVRQYVNTMAAIPDHNTPGDSTPTGNDGGGSGAGKALLYVFGGLIGLAALGFGGFAIADKRSRTRQRRDQLNRKINDAEAAVNDLAEDVLQGVDVSSYQTKAALALSAAKTARDKKLWAEAESQVDIANRYVQQAYGTASPDTASMAKTPRKDRRKATVAATDPTGKAYAVTNTDFRRNRDGAHRHYYAGGQTQGVYFEPGWYPYPFWLYTWNPTDVTWLPGTVDADKPKYTSSLTDASFTTAYSGGGSSHHRSSSYSGSSSGSGDSSSSSHSSSSYSGGYSSPSTSADFGGGFSGGFDGGGFSGGFDGGGSAGF